MKGWVRRSNNRYGCYLADRDGREREAERLLHRAIESDPHFEKKVAAALGDLPRGDGEG